MVEQHAITGMAHGAPVRAGGTDGCGWLVGIIWRSGSPHSDDLVTPRKIGNHQHLKKAFDGGHAALR